MFAAVFAACLFSAETAYGWGPATHVALGGTLLEQLSLLPAGIAALLLRHRSSYLYGNIAADVVFAKRWSRVRQFCHHWSTGFRVLERAEDDAARAFALGYLSHLAADTVAHGKFVPRQVVVSGHHINMGHLYWELRADGLQRPRVWATLRSVLRENHDRHHRELAPHLRDTLLSYDVNRALFDGINVLALQPGFRWTVARVNAHSRWHLAPDLVRSFEGECVDRMLSVLRDGERSPILRDDPNGTSALMSVHAARRDERRLRRAGLPVDHRRREFSAALAPVAIGRPVGPLAVAGTAGSSPPRTLVGVSGD